MIDKRSKQIEDQPFLRGVMTGITATFIAYSLFLNPNDTQSNAPVEVTPADSIPNICPKKQVDVVPEPELQPIEFTIDEVQLSMYTELLNQAQTFDEAQNLLNQVFSRWDYSVHIAEVPTLSSQDFETRGSDIEHTPELITQQLVNVSSIHILESLGKIPETLMYITRGTDMYLTMGAQGESGGYAGLYAKDENGKPIVLVGIGPADPSGEIFEHEVIGHNLFFRLCGDNIGHNDNELASFNPPSWVYTRADVPNDYWRGITASRYGATNTAEDTADAFPELLVLPLGRTCLRDEVTEPYISPICNKWDLLIQRVAVVSPQTAAYLARS